MDQQASIRNHNIQNKRTTFLIVILATIAITLTTINIRIENFTTNLSKSVESLPKATHQPENGILAFANRTFIGVPNFYIKTGHNTRPHHNVLTICSICSLDILHQSRSLALNYKSGPLSFAVFMAADISHYTNTSQATLRSRFAAYFHHISNPYDLHIGLIYVNKSTPFWRKLGFTKEVAMAWRIPVNAMRNLAEVQAQSKWLMTVDIDFELYSTTIHNPVYISAVLNKLPTHTLLVVPSFAMDASYIGENRTHLDFNNLTRTQLISLVPDQVLPFYYPLLPQNCTDYPKWYKAERHYLLDLARCNMGYEPYFIMDRITSRQYAWDSRFTGRHLDKIQRMQMLRYHEFTAIVLYDAFMIHVNRPHDKQSSKRNGFSKRQRKGRSGRINVCLLCESYYSARKPCARCGGNNTYRSGTFTHFKHIQFGSRGTAQRNWGGWKQNSPKVQVPKKPKHVKHVFSFNTEFKIKRQHPRK